VGSSGVGKTGLISRFLGPEAGQLGESERPDYLVNQLFRSDLTRTRVQVGNQAVQVYLLDMMGIELFSDELASAYLRSANVILFCFDVTDRASFTDVVDWFKLARRAARHRYLTMYLVANKIDRTRHRQVSLPEIRAAADRLGLHLLETSTIGSLGDGLRGQFERLVADALRNRSAWLGCALEDEDMEAESPSATIRLDLEACGLEPSTRSSGGSCFGAGRTGARACRLPPANATQLMSQACARYPELGAMEMLRFVSASSERRAAQRRTPKENQALCPLGCGSLLEDRAKVVQDHVSEACPRRKVNCPLGCGAKVPAHAQIQHTREECPERVVQCQVCGALVAVHRLDPHCSRWRVFRPALWSHHDLVHWVADNFGRTVASRLSQSPFATWSDGRKLHDEKEVLQFAEYLRLDAAAVASCVPPDASERRTKMPVSIKDYPVDRPAQDPAQSASQQRPVA